MKNKILVIAAHPDDEILGCGGTMAKYANNGHEVHALILGEGITSRDKIRDPIIRKEDIDILHKAAQEANYGLGVASLHLHKFTDNRMDGVELLSIVKCIEKHIHNIRPNIVFTHHSGDVNIDHQIVHKAVVTSCRPIPGFCVENVLFFEVPSSTEWSTPSSALPFSPNWFEDISGVSKSGISYFEMKLKSLECYYTEMRDWPHPRSFEAVEYLAKYRGMSCGIEAAEAFILGRSIKRI